MSPKTKLKNISEDTKKMPSKSSIGRTCFPEAYEVQDILLGWQSDGQCVLGHQKNHSVGLFMPKYKTWGLGYILRYLTVRPSVCPG